MYFDCYVYRETALSELPRVPKTSNDKLNFFNSLRASVSEVRGLASSELRQCCHSATGQSIKKESWQCNSKSSIKHAEKKLNLTNVNFKK